jgi:hypothetical protein
MSNLMWSGHVEDTKDALGFGRSLGSAALFEEIYMQFGG